MTAAALVAVLLAVLAAAAAVFAAAVVAAFAVDLSGRLPLPPVFAGITILLGPTTVASGGMGRLAPPGYA